MSKEIGHLSKGKKPVLWEKTVQSNRMFGKTRAQLQARSPDFLNRNKMSKESCFSPVAPERNLRSRNKERKAQETYGAYFQSQVDLFQEKNAFQQRKATIQDRAQLEFELRN